MNEEYISALQIAQALMTSKTTVKRTMTALNIKPAAQRGQMLLYTPEDAATIYKHIKAMRGRRSGNDAEDLLERLAQDQNTTGTQPEREPQQPPRDQNENRDTQNGTGTEAEQTESQQEQTATGPTWQEYTESLKDEIQHLRAANDELRRMLDQEQHLHRLTQQRLELLTTAAPTESAPEPQEAPQEPEADQDIEAAEDAPQSRTEATEAPTTPTETEKATAEAEALRQRIAELEQRLEDAEQPIGFFAWLKKRWTK